MTVGNAIHPIHRLGVVVVALATLFATPAAAQGTPPMPRVRSENPRIAQIIADGSVSSPTFRSLITAIDGTDGIVYVAAGQCGGGARACLAHSLQLAGPHRILRVIVSTRRDCDELLGAIGHELYHALEILQEREIKTSQAMFFHFFGASTSRTSRFEANGAIDAGARIENELRDRTKSLRDQPMTRSVRTSHQEPRLAELLAVGISTSETFRGLVEALDASDVIVYVFFTSSPKLRSYLLHNIVVTGTYRYLRVVIDIKVKDREVIPLLAHELQHAMEVAQSRDVRDSAAMEDLFKRIGYPVVNRSQVRETDAAVRAEQRVTTELSSAARCQV